MKGIENTPELSSAEQEQIGKILERLKTTANIIGGDFGMEVKLGEPGQGSFFNTEEVSITFDPNHILKDSEQAEVIAIHEGSHRAISRGPTEIGLKREEIPKIFDNIGFNLLYQTLEDNAVNTWAGNCFEYGRDVLQRRYENDFQVLDTRGGFIGSDNPQVRALLQRLGRIPKFLHYGTEARRWWLKGELAPKLDQQVRDCLEKTIRDFERAYKEIPGAHPSEKEVIKLAKKRFVDTYTKVWPEYKKLVDEDISDEKLRQMLKEDLEKLVEELQNDPQSGSGKSPLDELPPELRKELAEKIQRAMEDFENEQQSEEQGQGEGDSEESEPQSGENGGGPKRGDDGDEGESAEKQEAEGEGGASQPTEGEEMSQPSEKSQEGANGGGEETDEKEQIIPIDKFSEKLKQALKEIFDKLPQEKKDQLVKQAMEELARIEDAISEAMKSQLSEDITPTHEEIEIDREKSDQEKEEEKKRQEQEKEREKSATELEKTIEAQLTEYDRYYKEVAPIVNDLFNRAERIFQPNKQPRWQKGYLSGGRLDLQAAREFERDRSKYTGLWEQKTIPQKRDYRFVILVDMSGSMQDRDINDDGAPFGPTKIQETFKGVIVLSEVLNKLRIDNEVIGFTTNFPDSHRVYKKFEEVLDGSIRDKMTRMLWEGGDFTPTDEATAMASKLLEKKGVRNQFLVTLTDGQPDSAQDTKMVIAKIRETTNQKLIGIGLGANTRFVGEFYPASVVLPDISQFSQKIADLFEEMIRNPEKYK